MEITRTDLPTFYEIKAEDRPPFGKCNIRVLGSLNCHMMLSHGFHHMMNQRGARSLSSLDG